MSQVVSFYAYSASTGQPLAGLSPSFASIVRREINGNHTDLMPGPGIDDLGDGLYEFTLTDEMLPTATSVAFNVSVGAQATTPFVNGEANGTSLARYTPATPTPSDFPVDASDYCSKLTITSDDVVAIAGELANEVILAGDWARVFGWTCQELTSRLGSQEIVDRCGTYLAAHLMALLLQNRIGGIGASSGGGASGPVTSVRVGQVAQTFATAEAWKGVGIAGAQLATTSYGREYMRLIRLFLGGGTILAGGSGGLGPIVGC